VTWSAPRQSVACSGSRSSVGNVAIVIRPLLSGDGIGVGGGSSGSIMASQASYSATSRLYVSGCLARRKPLVHRVGVIKVVTGDD
jgi:hypothetical protein